MSAVDAAGSGTNDVGFYSRPIHHVRRKAVEQETWRNSADPAVSDQDEAHRQPMSDDVLYSTTDLNLLRSEIKSVNARMRRLNAENDDLLQRLGDAKRSKADRDRETESLTRRIAELEASSAAAAEPASAPTDHDAQQLLQDVQELRQQLAAERQQHQANQTALLQEIQQLQESAAALSRQLDDAKNEIKNVRSNSISAEREQQLEARVVELMASLEQETKKRQALVREHQTEMEDATERERQTTEKNDELKHLLEREEKRRLEVARDAQDQHRVLMEKELAYQKELDEMKTVIAELKPRIDVLSSSLDNKERLLEEIMQEKAALAAAKEEILTTSSHKEVQLQSQIDSLMSTVSDKERELDEINWKLRDLRNSKEHLELKEKELERALNETRNKLHESEEKNRKLERAVVRLKLENDRMTSQLNDHLLGADEHLKNLLREQESHIGDLQTEVATMRATLKDFPRSGSKNDGVDRGRLRASSDKADEDDSQSGSETRRQLELARRRLDASGKRVSQLERWLDEIYNDRELGLGPQLAARHREAMTSVTTAGRRTFRSRSTDKRSTTGAVTLPELRDVDMTRRKVTNRDGKPGWDNKTKIKPL